MQSDASRPVKRQLTKTALSIHPSGPGGVLLQVLRQPPDGGDADPSVHRNGPRPAKELYKQSQPLRGLQKLTGGEAAAVTFQFRQIKSRAVGTFFSNRHVEGFFWTPMRLLLCPKQLRSNTAKEMIKRKREAFPLNALNLKCPGLGGFVFDN